MTPEKKVQNSIIKYLKSLQEKDLPLYYERRECGGFNYHKGIADLYAVYKGVHIEIEVKKVGGLQSPHQEKWQQRCNKLKILYICTNSLEEFKIFFENLIEKIG